MTGETIGRAAALFTVVLALLMTAPSARAGDYDGWEADSEYNKLYDSRERDSIKGDIDKFITLTPMK